MTYTYKPWNDSINTNNELRQESMPMVGFLLPFMDIRAETVLHASIDAPSSTIVSDAA
ncbi:TPA: hypothetical protein QDB07_006608 [Burkholderia vietnamiensis]|uniref:hypothetical protein n=1 Tax=Burkholderia vietnamiensis TaxID=60552 RepID=UPI001B900A02|nr:hypothetical protein [Burkholderia vietnamiensis]MBR8084520.1 hypothetical protein [Burkholderia vietnamiensis]MDN7820918.1 hypothetical protein [Burkholderia vietnamiensis]HDR9039030.1 hypothetical protein [Burkholderia vietnamiensis]